MRSLTVMIIDDHPIVRRGLKDVIERASGMEVVGEAGDGREGVRLACQHRPDVAIVDVSLSDVVGSDINGYEVTELILNRCPEVAVLALTMHSDRAFVRRMLEAGAAGYILKQSSDDDLLRAIRMVASGKGYVDPTLGASVLRGEFGGKGEPGPPDDLSTREEEVLRLVAWGHGNQDIGRELGISPRTVETYRSRIEEKLGLRTRPELVRYAVLRGWLSSE